MKIAGWFALWVFGCLGAAVYAIVGLGIRQEIAFATMTGLLAAAMPSALKQPHPAAPAEKSEATPGDSRRGGGKSAPD